MAYESMMDAARAALWADGAHGVAHQHEFVCHGDGSPCTDGCDVAADPERIAALHAAACEERDPFTNGDHATYPAWYVQRQLTYIGVP
jgi:hypothetical protein